MDYIHKPVKVYFDIETFASWNKPSLDDIEAPANYKDPDKIKAYKEENLDKIWRKQALDPLKGQVICIGYAIGDEPVETIFNEDEEQLMLAFTHIMSRYPNAILVAHNALRFDIPFLYLRSIKYKLRELRSLLPQDKRDTTMVYDTLSIFASTSYGSDGWHSLSDLAGFLGIESDNTKGSEVHDMFVNKEYDKIREHCKKDVELLRTIYKLTE